MRATTAKAAARKKGSPRPSREAPAAPKRSRADKLSISLPIEEVRWLTRRAKRLGTSVSAVISVALAAERRAEARKALLGLLGEGDVTDADLDAARREAFGE